MTLQDALVIMADHHNNRSYRWDLQRNPTWREAARIVRERANEILQRESNGLAPALPPFDYPKEDP